MTRKSTTKPDPWAAIGGVDDARARLIEALVTPLRAPAALARLGITPARGFLLYGAPGIGKVRLAQIAAQAADATLVAVSVPEILAAGPETGAAALRAAFAKARAATPAMIVMGELELLAPARAANSSEPQRSEILAACLLAELDQLASGCGVAFVGATSRPNSIDAALLRPGRLDELIYVPVPDAAGRAAILAIQTAKVKLAKDVDRAALVARTDRFTAADFEDLIRRAGLHALRQSLAAKAIAMADFNAALAETQASVTEAMEKEYEKVQGAIKHNALKLEPMGFFGPGQLKPVRDSKHDPAERALGG